MANGLFTSYRNALLGLTTTVPAQVDFDTDTISICFYDTADTPNPTLASSVWLADVTAAGCVPATPYTNAPNLGTKTIGTLGAGVAGAANTVFTALATADQVEWLVMFKKITSAAASPLMAMWDTFASGMPLTPNGGDVTVQWNGSGIFQV